MRMQACNVALVVSLWRRAVKSTYDSVSGPADNGCECRQVGVPVHQELLVSPFLMKREYGLQFRPSICVLENKHNVRARRPQE